jgi:antitoxin component YwqK of YwqJK toxin-antitoxin module
MIKTGQIFILLLLIISSCENKYPKPVYKSTYYPSGSIKSSGWYINDSIPIRTLINFYENGNIERIINRDEYGVLNGMCFYYDEQGRLYSKGSYTDNLLEGFWYELNTGTFDNKSFYFNGVQVGDVYGYDTLGRVNYYAFFDFNTRLVILQTWDQHENLEDDLIKQNFDIRVKHLEKNKFEVAAILANPPKYNSKLRITYKSRSGETLKSDSICNTQLYYTTVNFGRKLSSIVFESEQYDSITGKIKYQNFISKMDW